MVLGAASSVTNYLLLVKGMAPTGHASSHAARCHHNSIPVCTEAVLLSLIVTTSQLSCLPARRS